ncbi:EPM2AIP1 [Cordylochernes scorpioides]|uniref:EPM2AIP1 n=1 Tax=Cordylochernes scorpioides TaxID=51811 RepID=A0ABY6KRA0_9ARAC|nr:EPM2AIP1 [Cordylochernes scorpioides]
MPGHRKRRQFKQTDAFTRGMVSDRKGQECRATRVTSARVDRRILRQAVAAHKPLVSPSCNMCKNTLDQGRMEKKRKIDSECRKFKDQWNIQYFVIESRIVRTEKFEALKRGLKSQQSLFTKVKTEQEAATRASFRVALEIAKRGKPFTDGEMIKECIIAVVEEMCPEKVNLLKPVSMSANTVARRVENIAENISSQLFDKNGHVEWFSLALNESTDVSDTAQVLIYIRGVDKSYEVHEELLDMYSIHGTTTGTDIFKGVEMAINKKNLRWKTLKCITTDGGKNMSGKDKGVVALVSKAVENDGGSKPLVLHCIIHQQSLCGKCLDMSDVLKPVISTVNFIRSFGLNHRQFRQFIAEIGDTDLPYHTAVRWLSCGKVLQRFFELRAVIEIFLNEKHRPLNELQNNAWLWNHTTETEFPIDFAIETLSALKINFDTRFSDFDAIANQIKIFQNPFDADIETLAPELQMEMIDLQCSDIIKNKYENSSFMSPRAGQNLSAGRMWPSGRSLETPALDHSISTRTISRRLVANGLPSCRPLRRLPLTPPNRRQRLEWCRARSTWMTEWHRVVFSDESRFCLSSDSRRVRVWPSTWRKVQSGRNCGTPHRATTFTPGYIGRETHARGRIKMKGKTKNEATWYYTPSKLLSQEVGLLLTADVGLLPGRFKKVLRASVSCSAPAFPHRAVVAQNKETRESLNDALRAQNQETREALQAQNQETREAIQAQNQALQAQHQELKESLALKFKCLEDEISAVKEDISSVKEEMKEEMASLKERLAAVETGHQRTPVFQQENNNSGRPLVKVLTSFKTQFDVVAQANGWNVRDKASFLAAALRGPAVDVLQMIPEQLCLDFNALIDALESRYGEEHYQQLHVVKFKNRLQDKKESSQDFANDIQHLARLAFPTCPSETQNFMAQQQFIDAIGDPETQKFSRLSSATTLQETLFQAMKYEAAQQATIESYRVARQVKLDNPEREKSRFWTYNSKDKPERKRGRCWTCGAHDHISLTCPRKVIQRSDIDCWSCGQYGHMRRNCPDNSETTTAPRKNLGRRNDNADALSRRPCVPQSGHCSRAKERFCVRQVRVQESDKVEEKNWTGQAIRKAQREDRDLLPMINWKESGEKPSWEDVAPYSPETKSLWRLWNYLTLRERVLYRNWESEDGKRGIWKLVLPRSHVPLALQEMHSSPTRGSRNDVEKWCRNCTQCSVRKGPTTRSRRKLKIYNVDTPFERMQAIHQWAGENLNFSSEQIKDRYNVKTSNKTFKEGEMVRLPNPQRKKGLSPKLQYQWEGPYKIINCLNDVIFRISGPSAPGQDMPFIYMNQHLNGVYIFLCAPVDV